MTTFDLAEVRGFTAALDARMNSCDNGEGMECANLEDAMAHYAHLCGEFREQLRQWGRGVFAGRVAFDPEVERVWRDEGRRLYSRAAELVAYGHEADGPCGPCYTLDTKAVLQSALWDLYQLLEPWVTPRLAVGPAARQGLDLTPDASIEARKRIDSLPPLPADWLPADPSQRRQFARLRRRKTS